MKLEKLDNSLFQKEQLTLAECKGLKGGYSFLTHKSSCTDPSPSGVCDDGDDDFVKDSLSSNPNG